jgi:hypothetical protein
MRTAPWIALTAVLMSPAGTLACTGPHTVRVADPAEVAVFFAGQGHKVLTFLGYSGAGYENPEAMLAQVGAVLDEHDPNTHIVNIGATQDGIGAAYALAKQRGFTTTGIVSTQAQQSDATLSPCVDIVFYVPDAAWGGIVAQTGQLSPTSTAMVQNSDLIVAIGGGSVARDELNAARRMGKSTRFIPADLNHTVAIDKARSKGQPEPSDFRGAAGAAE